ncbi:DUF2334 domain-containing protein [Methanothermococcus sp. Ax23]|uniref:DUF2334 domain-containing protein n=1 Tax=Methanothermococcus sp. Ax23 TaxID=3156486 RepID=UPI003BA2BB35
MNKKISYSFIFLIIIIPLLISTFEINNNYEFDPLSDISDNTTQKPIILVHDVSPKYFNELKDIEKIINKHHYQNRTYLFVIVNHANEYNLKDYPEFVKYLHHLENEGYHIEYHAYNHINREYDCNRTVAGEKLDKSFKILEDCGFDTKNIKYFIPPRYGLSKDAEEVFLDKNISIIVGPNILKKENNSIKRIIITNKEYTWYLPKNLTKTVELLAVSDYKTSQHQFCLSIHPKAVNYGGGLKFLDYFLNETR